MDINGDFAIVGYVVSITLLYLCAETYLTYPAYALVPLLMMSQMRLATHISLARPVHLGLKPLRLMHRVNPILDTAYHSATELQQ